MKKLLSFALVLGLYTQVLFAQDKIECDRPDQTETPSIVPNGYFQMENGFYYVHEGKDEKGFVYPTSLLKYGIKDFAEFRLEIENSSTLLQDENGKNLVHGISPLAFGMKLKICE